MSSPMNGTGFLSMGAPLSVVLVEPNAERRNAVAALFSGTQSRVSREVPHYPSLDELTQILNEPHDVVFVDLDSDPERALDVIETACAANSALTVIVYAARTEPELLVRCMRAGAREFLSDPVLPASVAEALVRASVRRDEVRRVRKALGKLYVFVGAKGGSGATTVASNFAIALARDTQAKVALVDLDLHLGDAALALGVTSKFSVADALENIDRLDSEFLSVLVAKHSSGVVVLPAPDRVVPDTHPLTYAIARLIQAVREGFEYVVVDTGTKSACDVERLFEAATTVYLVTQVSVPELRNANRLITHYFSGSHQNKLEIVLNRVSSRGAEIDDAGVAKALTRTPKWKLPSDYMTARRAQNTAVPLVMEDSALARCITLLARDASGYTEPQEKKRRFGLFR